MRPVEDIPARTDQTAPLERALIAEFLERRGLTIATLSQLPEDDARALMREASSYASMRLAEVESRAHYIHELHHTE